MLRPTRIDFTDDGRFMSRSTNKSFDFLELAKEAANLTLPDDLKGGVSIITDNEMHDPVFPNGTAVCEVEVDPDTGVVDITRYSSIDDVGRCINPLIVHGQTHGAIAQGVGQAMWEQCYTDPDSGQPLCGSLMDYGMPRADNIPSFTCEIAEVLSPTNPLGIKAGGEGGTTGAPAAVVARSSMRSRSTASATSPCRRRRTTSGRRSRTRRGRRADHRFRCALISSNLACARSNFSLNSHIAARISR